MKTTFISTSAISAASRLSLVEIQTKLAAAQKEVTTGRYADVGLTLGYKAGQTVSLRQELARLQTITDTNAVATARLDASQAALADMIENVQGFIGQLIGARDSASGPSVAQQQAKLGLGAFIDSLNTTIDGAFVFSGINADVKAVSAYIQSPISPAQQAVADAFQTTFGFPQSDPAAVNITAVDMQAFLDTTFTDLFDAAGWTTNWSAASDQNVKSRISTSELIETATNANAEAFRDIAKAYTMVADLGIKELNDNAFQAVADEAIRVAGGAIQKLTQLQSMLGTAQERIANANDRMAIQINVVTTHIGALEGVDPAEASTRVATLLTQIEVAYALTARIQRLSLLNYLPA